MDKCFTQIDIWARYVPYVDMYQFFALDVDSLMVDCIPSCYLGKIFYAGLRLLGFVKIILYIIQTNKNLVMNGYDHSKNRKIVSGSCLSL